MTSKLTKSINFATHLIEKNERLFIGLKKETLKFARHDMKIEYFSFNGINIGPD